MMAEIPDDINMSGLASIPKLGLEWKIETGTGEFLQQLQELYTSLHQPSNNEFCSSPN